MLREKSQSIRSEAHAIRNKSFLARRESKSLGSLAEAIRNRSEILLLELQALKKTLYKSDEKICMLLIERNITFNDLKDALDTTSLFEDLKTDSSSNEKYVINGNKERSIHMDKTNKLIDQVNLLAKTRNDFSKNVNDICMLMNEFQDEIYDDSWLRLVELNKINVLIDESLDYVWKMIYAENREKHEKISIDKDKDIDGYVSIYTDIINDKLELMNRIGELLDSIMVEVLNVVDKVRETDNYSLINDIIIKNNNILELINSVNVCARQDTKKKDKLDIKKKDKLDTKKKDKPDTKKINPILKRKINLILKRKINLILKRKINLILKRKINLILKKKNKPDTKKKDKPDIEKHRSESLTLKSELHKTDKPQKTNEPPKTLNHIKKILECFVCEKFMNEKFRTTRLSRDKISLYSIYTATGGFKKVHRIGIYSDMISLNTEKQTKSIKQDNSICIEDKQIIFKISQTEDYGGIQKKLNMLISIYNDKFTCNISTTTNENFTKDVNEEIECTSC